MFGEEFRGPNHDVGTEDVFDGIQNSRMQAQIARPLEVQMHLPNFDCLGLATELSLERIAHRSKMTCFLLS
jgi:hypothetical protein